MKDICYRSLGETWLAILREVYQSSQTVGDDTRELLQVCATFAEGDFDSDPLLVRFASRENVDQMRKVFFTAEANEFGHSYRDRIRGPRGRCDLGDVIELLDREPLTERAAIVLVGEGDGRVPCINAVHFLRRGGGLVTTYFARGPGCLPQILRGCNMHFRNGPPRRRAVGVPIDRVTGVISSAHIYLADLAAVDEVLTGAGVMPRAAAGIGSAAEK